MNKSITVIAKVTSACNLNCPYCYTRSTIKNGSYMPIDTFKMIVREVCENYDSAEIIFHGGEPTLMSYEWFKEAIGYVNKYKKMYGMEINLGIQTNLTNYTEEKFKLFSENNIGVGFSYDGLTNSMTRSNDEKILNNYYEIVEKFDNIKPSAISLVTSNNYMNIMKESEYFKSLNVDSKLNIVFNTETMVDNVNVIDYDVLFEQYKLLIDEILDSHRHNLYSTFAQEFLYATGNRCNLCANIDCRGKWISVHPDGNMYPCGQEWRQKNDNYYLGNIKTDSISDAFNSANFKTFIEKTDNKIKQCETCEIFDFCKGGCPGESFSNTGDVDGKNDKECEFDIKILNYIKEKVKDKNKIKNRRILNMLKRGNR